MTQLGPDASFFAATHGAIIGHEHKDENLSRCSAAQQPRSRSRRGRSRPRYHSLGSLLAIRWINLVNVWRLRFLVGLRNLATTTDETSELNIVPHRETTID
jgi:hypothetical protein